MIASATQLRVYVAVVAEWMSEARRLALAEDSGGCYAGFVRKAFSEFVQSKVAGLAALMQNMSFARAKVRLPFVLPTNDKSPV